MSEDKLILTSFAKALASLDEALAMKEDKIVRDASIQRFEYTYELSWKMMKRHLEWTGNAEVGSLSRRELFREAARVKLIEDAEVWFDYHQARNQTAHTYEEETAKEVYQMAKKFAPDAHKLLRELEKHHD
ncbi:MAG TPA: nucleotidyltransferase substrate binding protein [Pyrinomonadaceae bacterium]|jgi:nucleotidyltransferase substrate binding protein (TIGR01987 family)|nr:nucleotidyltransferase substrate binding protein [Pyrinomonadaceae bacterium]